MLFHFDGHVLDLERRELYCGVEQVSLEPQVFDLLVHLVRNRNRVISKGELIEAVWGGRIVSDATIDSRVKAARQAVGDSGGVQRIIRTVQRKGVRLIAEVQEQHDRTTLRPGSGAASLALTHPLLVISDKPSIAVLAFDNMSGSSDQEYFSDGMTDEIITALSRLRWLFVIARTSTFTYKGCAIDVRRVAADLGVRYVLEGSVRRAGNRLRVTAQLIDAEQGRHLWAERYDHRLDDIFAIQDEITNRIVATLDPEISGAEQDRARRKPPASLGAWELYQQGMWHLLRRNREDMAAGRQQFHDALRLDPNFATAHAALAIAAFWQITHNFAPDVGAMRGELHDAAARAIECDGRDFLAHSAMGLAFMELGQYESALAEHDIATTLNPNSAFAQWCYGYALGRTGQQQNALARFDLALQLSPRDPSAWAFQTLRANALYLLDRFEEAVIAARNATRTPSADLVWPLVHYAASLGQLGRGEEAALVIRELQRVRPGLTIAGVQAWPHVEHRSIASVEKMLDGLRKAGLPE